MQNMRTSSKDLPSPNVGQIVERKIRKIECTNAEKKKSLKCLCSIKKSTQPLALPDIGMLNINIDFNLCLSKESH